MPTRRVSERFACVHVVVVGCGRVGSSLALDLTEGGHTVAVIDRNPDAFRRLGSSFSGQTIAGVGFDRDRLIAAGIENASALAAVTSGDNSNIVIARVARETYGIARVVARIYDPKRAAVYQRLGIATVATVAWTTERILRRMLPDEPAVEWVDPSAKVAVIERALPPAWAGHLLSELDEPAVMRVIALSRLGAGQLPRPNAVIQEGDVVHLAVASDAMADVDARLVGPARSGGH
jgi:trk system potassium uptake protein